MPSTLLVFRSCFRSKNGFYKKSYCLCDFVFPKFEDIEFWCWFKSSIFSHEVKTSAKKNFSNFNLIRFLIVPLTLVKECSKNNVTKTKAKKKIHINHIYPPRPQRISCVCSLKINPRLIKGNDKSFHRST